MAGVRDQALKAKGYQQLTVGIAAVSPTVPAGSVYALIKLAVAANTLRYRDDGTDPTSTVGFPVDSTVPFWYTGQLQKMRFIRSAAADAVLEILYYA